MEGCSEHADPHWMVDFVKKLREDTASVVAKAIVSAYVTCTATGAPCCCQCESLRHVHRHRCVLIAVSGRLNVCWRSVTSPTVRCC